MSLIVCKKCGGPHITLKCGKEPKPIETKPKPTYKDLKEKKSDFLDKRKIVTIKISNLPNDITVYELEKLMNDWGSIARVNLNYSENKMGFVDFFFKDEADYFIKAIDRTPFDSLIIRAEYN
jgi:hypothetical protein